jgi:serine/threonine protein kinase
MELCVQTLKDVIENLNLNLNEELRMGTKNSMTPIIYYVSCEIFIEILECVSFLHKQNVIHRDLKPPNILITEGINGRFIKIADLGLSKIHEKNDQSHTQFLGTLNYMAPEVVKSKKYNTKADIYSLGVIIKELFNFESKM